MIYIKPNVGTFGGGVMRVEKLSGGTYQYQLGERKRTFGSYDELYADIRQATNGRRYLAQQGIALLRYDGRRFDVRVMVQQNPAKQWETTGLIGRLAHPKRIVTNFHNGGTLMRVGTLLGPHLTKKNKQQFLSQLRRLGVRVGEALEAKFPGIKEIGIDIGVDHNFHPWILEVNTKPDPYIFRKLGKEVSRRVFRYARAYGRIK